MDQDDSYSYVSQTLSAIKFVHRHVLHCQSPVASLPRPRSVCESRMELNRVDFGGLSMYVT